MRLKCIVAALSLCVVQGAYATAVKGNHLDLFTPFSWEQSTSGYIIKGKTCNKGFACGPVTMVVDPANKRFFLDLGENGGTFYLLNDKAFVNNVVANVCLRVADYNFDKWVKDYNNITSMKGSKKSKARYLGITTDFNCKDTVAAEILTQKDFVTEYNFGTFFPVPGVGCLNVTASVVFDPNTVDRTSDKNEFFANMPDNCNDSAPTYCETVYPPNNACGI